MEDDIDVVLADILGDSSTDDETEVPARSSLRMNREDPPAVETTKKPPEDSKKKRSPEEEEREQKRQGDALKDHDSTMEEVEGALDQLDFDELDKMARGEDEDDDFDPDLVDSLPSNFWK